MKRSPEKQKEFSGLNTEPLINFNIGKIYASVVLDIRNRKKDGYYPVKVRVFDEQRKQYYWDCTSVTALEYHKLHSKKPDAYTKKTLAAITIYWENFKDTLTDLVNKEGFSKTRLDQRLAKGAKDSVIEAFDTKIAELEKKNRIGSVVWYTGARNSIKKFIGDEDLKFAEVTPDWLESYQTFLRKEEYDTKGNLIVKAKKDTTISIIMRALRAIMNTARGKIITEDQYPFGKGKYEIPTAEGRIIALSETQIKKIAKHPMNPEALIYRRLWLFSYFCNGINIGDMLRLKYRDITKDDGRTFIEWEREKTKGTGKKIKALMRPEMQKIIDLHGNRDKRPDSYVFPFLEHRMTARQERDKIQNLIHTINKKMTAIGRALGYGDVTSYWARHAFTNNSLNKKVSMFSLSDRLGHATVKTTQIYAGRLSNKQIIKDANVLDTVEI
ncbi:MAG TPA: hypothetical protein DDW27_14745 [Bacteroidales bacterium]|nr:hypothetical protein [Bacteroidales bacterium]